MTENSPTELRFPPEFLWGTATAAYQVEGAAQADGRTDSIWDAFCREPGAVRHGHDGAVAVDHYHRYREDVALMRRLNLTAYRFSTSWARVRPDGGAVNPRGLDFYSRLVDELLDAEIVPWLTLYHWDLPQALQEHGGWTNRDTAHRFVDYALSVQDALGDRVRFWTTMNEPWCSAFLGHVVGEHAPGHTSPTEGIQAAHHLLLAHGLAVRELRAQDPAATLGITLNLTVADPADPAREADRDAARRVDGAFNRIFLDPLFRGTYPEDVRADMVAHWPEDLVQPGDLEVISTPLDVLGVNYYNGSAVAGPPEGQAFGWPSGTPAPREPGRRPERPAWVGSENIRSVSRGLPTTAMGWEVQPDGLTRLLTRLQDGYSGPAGTALYVTENGAAYDDEPGSDGFVQDDDRLDYVEQHLRALHAALQAGVDVRGYFLWSLMDNFEWAFGYDKRFGIVRVDYETLARTPKASAHWYAQVAATGTLPASAPSTSSHQPVSAVLPDLAH